MTLSPAHNGQTRLNVGDFDTTSIIRDEYSLEVNPVRFHGRNKYEKQLKDVKECLAVYYIMNLEFIEEWIEEIGMERLVVIIGKEFSVTRRKSLHPDLVKKLARWMKEDVLEIRVPKKGTWHEKTALCWNRDEEWFKDVTGSANPTLTGRGGRGQSNRGVVVAVKGAYEENDYYQQCQKHWQWYLDNSMRFLGDLVELLPESEEEWQPVIVNYLESDGTIDAEDTIEIRQIEEQIGKGLHSSSVRGNPIFQMSTEGFSDQSVDTVVERLSKQGLDIERFDDSIEAPSRAIDLEHYTKSKMPMMSIVDSKVWIRLNERNVCRTADEMDAESINIELKKLELYIDSISNAHRGDKKAKMAVAEYLLCALAAPFDHLYMRHRRRRFPRNTEGPRMTSYYGTAANGKSYASRVALKMLSGEDIEALGSIDFTHGKVRGYASQGNIFPMAFDDLSRDRIREWGEWGKFFWDRGYTDGSNFPNIIATANDRIDSRGPLGRRVREIAMHATFPSNEENSILVEDMLENCSEIFIYFSKLMIEKSADPEQYSHGDELQIARKSIDELYDIAQRPKPNWWPVERVEKIHDDNAYQWLDMINKNLVRKIQYETDEMILHFDPTAPSYEIARHAKLLPGAMAAAPSGTKIRIRNPTEFVNWLKSASLVYESKLRRTTRKLLKRQFS